jgi:hypothetical protein
MSQFIETIEGNPPGWKGVSTLSTLRRAEATK